MTTQSVTINRAWKRLATALCFTIIRFQKRCWLTDNKRCV